MLFDVGVCFFVGSVVESSILDLLLCGGKEEARLDRGAG